MVTRAIAGVLLLTSVSFAIEDIPAHQKKKIDQAVPAKARVEAAKPRRVLVFSTPDHLYAKDPHKGYCVPYGAYAFGALGEKTKAYQPVLSADLAMFLPDNLARFDAVVMNNSCGPWITPTDADMARPEFEKLIPADQRGGDAASTKAAVEQVLQKGLIDFVNKGGGIVAIHFAIAANRHWPQFAELIGGQFTGHPWNEEIGVCVEEPGHPLTAAFDGKDFRLADEIYQYGKPYHRSGVRVLLSLDPERTNMGVRWINQPDNDFALAWVKSVGKGRIFYTSFGHRTELFWHPQLLQMYLDAVQFASGDLDAPTAPRPDRPTKRMPGPTPPEQRLVLMKARKVPVPSDEEIARIEAAAPDKPLVKPGRLRKVLVWGHSWTHLPNPFAEKAIEILGRKTGAFTATVSDDPRLLIADRLAQFDALVMNNIHENEPFLPPDFNKLGPEQQQAARKMDQAIRQSILEFVAGRKEGSRTIPGKGIVGTHAATAALNNWPEYLEMMGGSFGGYILQDVAIKVEQPTNPLTACFSGASFAIHDEIYIFPQADQRQKLRILLSLDMAKTKFPDKVQLARPGLEKGRPDKDHAISWVRPYGTGRVFYTVLGHQPETHWNPKFLAHLLAGIQYAIGDLPGEAPPQSR